MHIEIPGGADTKRARAFWSALFGWQLDDVPVPSAEYLLTRINEGAALSNFEPNKRGIRPYFAVEDIDASIIRVAQLRGRCTRRWPSRASAGFRFAATPTATSSGCGSVIQRLSHPPSIQH